LKAVPMVSHTPDDLLNSPENQVAKGLSSLSQVLVPCPTLRSPSGLSRFFLFLRVYERSIKKPPIHRIQLLRHVMCGHTGIGS